MRAASFSSRRFRTFASAFAALTIGLSCEEGATTDIEFTVTPGDAILFVGETVQLTAVGAPGAVSWSSSNSNVATVIAETGFVRAVTRGEATISAVSGSSVATAAINVLVPPALGLSSPTIDFDKTVNEADPAAQTVTVRNTGDGTIDGIALGTIAYGQGQPTGWLTATVSGSTAPVTVTLTARGPTLPRGVYTATLPILASGIDNSPQNLAVTFRVLAPANIALSRTTVPMAGIPASNVVETVAITNAGDRPLTGLTATTTYGGGQPQGWLTTALSSTTAPSTLTLTANTGTLAIGNYTATVRVASSVAGVAARDVAVQLTVSPGPAIALSTTTATIQAATGTNPTATVVNVTNGGGGTLSGLTLDATQYTVGTAGWLNAVLGGATAPTTITLNVTSAALAQGSYTALVRVRSTVASNSPLTLTVNLNVGPPPTIAISPTSMSFATWSGAPSQYVPGAQALQVTNSGGGTLSGLQASVSYTSGTPGWMNVPQFLGGTTAPTQVLIRPQTAGLPAGTYTATVTISTSLSGIQARVLNVTYVVQSFTVNLHPTFNAYCSGCHFSGYGSGTPSTAHANLVTQVVPGSPSTSNLVCKIFGACSHNGGKYTSVAGFQTNVNSWILSGAPLGN